MGAFLTSLVAVISSEVAKQVLGMIRDEIKTVVNDAMYRTQAFEKADQEKTALAEEMSVAKTQEERDAILDKIYNAQPKFN